MTSNQVSENDLCLLRELNDSNTGIITSYEIAEMYEISGVELQRQLDSLDPAAAPSTTSSIEEE